MKGRFAYFACAILLVGASPSHATWAIYGAPVCTANYSQENPVVVSDAAGGAIVAWLDHRSGNYDIYAQRLDQNGNPFWAGDGVPVCTSASLQENIQMAADGAGGVVIVWDDDRNGNLDIYAQRISSSGSAQWTANGAAVIVSSGDQKLPQLTMTGTGTGIITWEGNGSGNFDIRAQKFNSSGNVQWGSSGMSICNATGDQLNPRIVSDGSGGAYIAWIDMRSGTYDIYAQRVSTDGSIQWASNGLAVCSAAGDQNQLSILDVGSGFIAVWVDARGTYPGIYAQRVSSTGSMAWTPDGVTICEALTGNRVFPKIVADGSGGAIIGWVDKRSGCPSCLYAQRVNSSGSTMWALDGAQVSANLGEWDPDDPLVLVSLGSGESMAMWWTPRSDPIYGSNIYAQRISADGNKCWDIGGVIVASGVSGPYDKYPRVTYAGNGQVIIAWMDARGSTYDIYAQMLGPNGYWGNQSFSFSASDVRKDQGGWVRLHTSRTLHDKIADPLPITGYCVWRKRTTSSLFLEEAKGKADAASSAQETLAGIIADPAGARGKSLSKAEAAVLAFPAGNWEVLGFYPAVQQDYYEFIVPTKNDSSSAGIPRETFFISAHTPSPSNYIVSPVDSGYSVDNLAPGVPHGLAAQQKYVPAGLNLTWHSNIESDLTHYAVYRGTSSGFVPGPSNLIASPTDTATFDGAWRWNSGYYYKVSAIDRHGNESGFALLTPDGVTGTGTPKAPEAPYLSQNFPNPFNPTTRIAFGLSAPGHVSLRIYDAEGRLVRVLVEGARPAGNYVEYWDGRDAGGASVASGVYFYRLDAGAFSQTRKMVLLR